MAKKIKSPCLKRCKYDSFELCIACYRTKNEIVGWVDFDNKQKTEVLKKIELRKQPGMKYKIP